MLVRVERAYGAEDERGIEPFFTMTLTASRFFPHKSPSLILLKFEFVSRVSSNF